MASDSWLHEFLPNPFDIPAQKRGFMDPFDCNNVMAEDVAIAMSTDVETLPKSEMFSDSTSEAYDMSSGYYAAVNRCLAHSDSLSGITQGPLQADPFHVENLKHDAFAWPQPLSMLGEDILTGPSRVFSQVKASEQTHDHSLSADDFKTNAGDLLNGCRFPNHDQAVPDLYRMLISPSHRGSSIAIDSILMWQRVLQELADTIFQCRICSQQGCRLLMSVIVSIDNLITTLTRPPHSSKSMS